MREKYLYPHTMFEMNAMTYCGVFMPEEVMRKIVKLQGMYMRQVQTTLNDNKDKLLVAEWTMATKEDVNGKIKSSAYVKYSDTCSSFCSVEERIELFKPEQPKRVDVYVCDRETARSIAEELLAEGEVDHEAD